MKVSYEPTHGMDDWLSETELIPVAGKHIVYVVVKDYLATHDYLVRFVRAKIDFYHGKPELQDNLKPQSVFEIYWNWAHAQWQRGFPFYLSHSSPLFFQYSFFRQLKAWLQIYRSRCWNHQGSFWWLMSRTKQMSLFYYPQKTNEIIQEKNT